MLCHSSGTEIDHIDGASCDPANLRLLCHSYHAGVTLSHCHHAPDKTAAELDALLDRLTAWIDVASPSRACDSDGAATWRSWTLHHAEH